MAMLKLPYVQSYTDRHGKRRHYFRRTGVPKVALPGVPGSAEFMRAYQAALDAAPLSIGPIPIRGSFGALILDYYQSAEFAALRHSTRMVRRRILEPLREEFGEMAVATLRPHHVRKLIDLKKATPSAANVLRKLLRVLLAFAVDRGYRDDNPVRDVRPLKVPKGGIKAWSDDAITRYRTAHDNDVRALLALDLALYTGARRGDLVRLGPQHRQGDRLTWSQEKTGRRVSIPLHPALCSRLNALDSGHAVYLITNYGAAFTAAGFGNWFKERCREAGLHDLSAHGLRKACARRLAEAGATPHEIMAVTGHQTLAEVERYTREAGTDALATRGISRLK